MRVEGELPPTLPAAGVFGREMPVAPGLVDQLAHGGETDVDGRRGKPIHRRFSCLQQGAAQGTAGGEGEEVGQAPGVVAPRVRRRHRVEHYLPQLEQRFAPIFGCGGGRLGRPNQASPSLRTTRAIALRGIQEPNLRSSLSHQRKWQVDE